MNHKIGTGGMSSKRIAIASDHAGYALKETLKVLIVELGHQVDDLGTHSDEPVDYPDYGYKLAKAVGTGNAEFGIAICGSGIGISIAANRHPNIRAALCHNGLAARLSRQHNDANILALGARLIGVDVAKDCVIQFLQTPFEGGRHLKRVEKLSTC